MSYQTQHKKVPPHLKPCFCSKIMLLFFVDIFLLLTLANGAEGKAAPNIVFIVADDYGFRDIGYHGAEFSTPNLDKLAAQGVKLENYYVQPICSPSRSQLMTGRYQIHTGLQHSIIWPSQPYGLPLEFPTMADFLKSENYSTHAVGKWHLGLYKKEYTPLYRGFDTFFGYWAGGEDYYTYYNCDYEHSRNSTYDDHIKPSFGRRAELHRKRNQQWCGYDLRDMNTPVTTMNGTYSTHLYTNKSIELIKNASASDKPFFLYLAYQAVHSPMEVPEIYMKPYSHIKNKYRRIYAGMVAAMDEGVGNVTSALKQYGLWEDTILIFTTDNGGEIREGGNNYPLRGNKITLWEGGVRGISFVSSPLLNESRRGKVSKELMHVSDWLPTVAGMVGSPLGPEWKIDGQDQWPMIGEGKQSPRNQILHNIDIWEPLKGTMLYNNTFDTRVRAALRVGDYKIITGNPGYAAWTPPPNSESNPPSVLKDNVPETKNLWLFNIHYDPSEAIDLSGTMPDKVQEMLGILAKYNATSVPPMYPTSDTRCDPKLRGNFWGPWE